MGCRLDFLVNTRVEGLGVSQWTADSLRVCLCACVYFQHLGISGHLSKQTFPVHLFMHTHTIVCLQTWFPVYVCLVLSAESVHYCHGRCILRPVPWLLLLAHRDAFSCSQRHFAWWDWAMASIRTDGTIWRETGKEEVEGGREGEVKGRKKWRMTEKRRCSCKDGVMLGGVIAGAEMGKRRVILVHIELCVHSNGQTAGHYW